MLAKHPYRESPLNPKPYKHKLEQKLSRLIWRFHIWRSGNFKYRKCKCSLCGEGYYVRKTAESRHSELALDALYGHLSSCNEYKESHHKYLWRLRRHYMLGYYAKKRKFIYDYG